VIAIRGRLDTLLSGSVARGEVPGVVAMVTDRNDVLYEGAFGARALGEAAAMTVDTVLYLASMTKPITAAAAMALVERGALDLDWPAGRWCPELGRVQVLEGFDATGEPILRPPRRPVTLRHLLTHTSGFGYEIWNADILRFLRLRGLPEIGGGRLAALGTPLVADPGERWVYGIGIDWAGRMVEAASGTSLGAFLREALFEPLGMASTGFRVTPPMRSRLAKVHQRGPDGALAAIDWEMPREPEFEEGGDGLYGTVEDYVRFARMILGGGKLGATRVLREETVATMATNHLGDVRVGALRTAMPERSNDVEFLPGVAKGWGLSFVINLEGAPGGRSAGSLAWAGIANTYFWIDPARAIAGVLATQVLPFADVHALPLALAFERTVYTALSGRDRC
jgi:CubicO group peptidase (beta-lactamase class C family)